MPSVPNRCANGCCPDEIYNEATHISNRIFFRDHDTRDTKTEIVGLLPNLTPRAGMQDLAYYYIQNRGPTNSAVLYSWLSDVAQEYEKKTFEPRSIQQLTQILTRSPLFNKIGKEAQRAQSAQTYTYEYPLWDIHDVDEVAQRIHNATHKRSVRRYPAILRNALKKLEVGEC